MAGNMGKYIDRSPIICPAGKPNESSNSVAATLQESTVEDEIAAIKHDAHIWGEEGFVPPLKLPPLQIKDFCGMNSQIKPIMNPPVKTPYQQFIEDLKSTPYSSYWNKELGKARDPVPGLPVGTDRYELLCGKPSVSEMSVKEIVNPSISHYDVLKNSQVGHDMYKQTHNDYNPSEKVCRGYCTPPYNPNACYGKKSKYDPRGIWVKCACEWFMTEPLNVANKVQADYLKKVRPLLGKPLAPTAHGIVSSLLVMKWHFSKEWKWYEAIAECGNDTKEDVSNNITDDDEDDDDSVGQYHDWLNDENSNNCYDDCDD